jgi:DNA helicase II / ATP-dependent DNA helicase PcrA
MQWLNELNEAQRRAVQAGEGAVVIVAGPGTGKTKTLTARIAYLLAAGAAQPADILALTFTKKAAEEMRSRVQALTPLATKTTISTFHALCFELLGKELAFIHDVQRMHIVRSLAKPQALKGVTARELALQISRVKNLATDDPELQKITAAYDAELAKQGLIDFDDLLVKTREKLLQDETERRRLQQRFRYILVDEFQDTNLLQYELLQLLRGSDNVFVIGDPNQSIYGFRGASGSIFEQFKQDFTDHTAVTLTVNYRSAPEIVRLSNAIFTEDTPLQAHKAAGGQVRAVRVLNEYSEASWVLGVITAAIGGSDMLQGVSDDNRTLHRTLRDFAVLYRSRTAALAIQKAIEASGLPYQIVGEGSPYEQPRVQALIALLRMVAGEEAELEGFTASEVTAIKSLLADMEGASPSVLAARLAALLGFEQSPGIQQCINMLVRFTTVAEAVAYFNHIAETGFYDPDAEVITLLTVHAAKGLEFPYVFLTGAEEGILPHERADVHEERRLFYVAVTRAREMLDITHTTTRNGKTATPSRFIGQVGAEVLPLLIDPKLAADAAKARKRALRRSQQSLF